jgi:hypothetical protein
MTEFSLFSEYNTLVINEIKERNYKYKNTIRNLRKQSKNIQKIFNELKIWHRVQPLTRRMNDYLVLLRYFDCMSMMNWTFSWNEGYKKFVKSSVKEMAYMYEQKV